MNELDGRIRSLLPAGEIAQATTLVLRDLGPEILGFLSGVLGDAEIVTATLHICPVQGSVLGEEQAMRKHERRPEPLSARAAHRVCGQR